jgi:AraC-like DNA-binding protein
MMTKPMTPLIPLDRLEILSSELRPHAPQWANRLAQARSKEELLNLVCHLFNLSYLAPPRKSPALKTEALCAQITLYISTNLHRGLTLKLLANFLGYSEKYCSDLFLRLMGESFSGYIKRHRVEHATSLLTATDKTVAEIASALGFTDQFAFSHFFKRATGHSPIEFRTQQGHEVYRQPVHPPPR